MMNKILKIGLISIGSIFALIVLIAIYFAVTFNPNDFKSEIVKLVHDKKQRTLKIDGDIKLYFWPKIGADLGKISLSEHQSDTEFASVNNVKVALSVLPLLKKEFVIDTIYVDGAKATIIKHKDGSMNIDDLLSKDKQESQTKFDIDGTHIINTALNYSDEATGVNYAINQLNLTTGHIAIAEPVDLVTDFKLKANKPDISATFKLKGNFLLDAQTKLLKIKGLESQITGEMFGGKKIDISTTGNLEAKTEQSEFRLDNLKIVASGEFNEVKRAIDLSAPSLTVLKDEVNSQKLTVSLSQVNSVDTLKLNMVLANLKGSPRAFQSSGITGDLSIVQGKRTVSGTFSSPFNGNLESLVFDIPKLTGNLDIKDPSLPNGVMKGSFNLGAHTDIKKEIANSQFIINLADANISGDVNVAGFKKQNIKFNLSANKLDLNKLLGKSSESANANKKPADISALKTMTIDGKINITSLNYDKYLIANLNLNVNADGDKLTITGLNTKFDDSQIKGSFGITNFAKPIYRFDLDIDSLDIDKYIVKSSGNKPATKSSSGMSGLKTVFVDGKIRIGNLKYDKFNAKNLSTSINADGEKLTLNHFNGKIDDSNLKGSLAISQFAFPKYTFDLDIDNLDLDRYISNEAPSKSTEANKSADLRALKELNADGSVRIGHFKYGKTNASNIRVDLKSDGQKLSLNPFAAKIDDSQVSLKLGITQFDNPVYNFNITIDKLDADKYITKSDSKTKSDDNSPIDLSALKKFNAAGEANIGWLKLANIKTSNVRIGLKADSGVATLSPFSANLYQGSMDGSLKVDARTTPNIAFKQIMKNISIEPLLQDSINNDMLSGTGNVNVNITTQGASVNSLKKALAGSASLSLADGAVKGIDIAGSIRDIKNKVNLLKNKDAVDADKTKKTDFSELTASFDIKNGVAHNEDLAIKAPILRLTKGDSKGDIDIGNETINYIAKPTLVKSLKGQGGAELDNLSGISIPIKISGTFSTPKFGMDLGAIGSALAQSKLIDKVGGDKADVLKGALNGDPKDALKGLLGKKKPTEATAPLENPSDASTAPTTPAETPKSSEDKAKEKLKKLLKF